MDAIGFRPWVGGVRRVTVPLTGYDLSADGARVALWGRADSANGRGPGDTVWCLDTASGEVACVLPGDGPVLDARFTRPDELWVLRADATPQHAVLRVHAIPDGGVLAQHTLAGVDPGGRIQWAPHGDRVLIAHDLGPWDDADRRDAALWHLCDAGTQTVLGQLNPYAVWAWSHTTQDTLDLVPWGALRARLCPDGQRVAVRADAAVGRREGALVLLDGVDRRGVAFPGAAPPRAAELVWLGPTRVAELGFGPTPGLHVTDAGEAYAARWVPVAAEGARGPWTPDRATLALSPDATRLLVSAWRFAAGPCRLGVWPLDDRARDLPLAAVEGSHPRSFAACWLDDGALALVLEGGDGRVRVVRYDPVTRAMTAGRSVPFEAGSELFRLRSPTGPWLGLDWYDPTVRGWRLALVPAAGLGGST